MDNINAREYVQTGKNRMLEAMALGEELISYLKSGFGFADYEFTRDLEGRLDEVADARTDYLTRISEVYKVVEREVDEFLEKKGRVCPDCGQPLRHIVKEGQGGYNFWACSDRDNCGAKFRDDGWEPGGRSGPAALSEHACQACGKPLRHIVKEGEGGYDFWACSDRDKCGAKYKDDGGKPGERSGPVLSEHKCQACGKPLRHIVT
jgi:DNA topoisomerase-1